MVLNGLELSEPLSLCLYVERKMVFLIHCLHLRRSCYLVLKASPFIHKSRICVIGSKFYYAALTIPERFSSPCEANKSSYSTRCNVVFCAPRRSSGTQIILRPDKTITKALIGFSFTISIRMYGLVYIELGYGYHDARHGERKV